jgi:hypothetical protein
MLERREGTRRRAQVERVRGGIPGAERQNCKRTLQLAASVHQRHQRIE